MVDSVRINAYHNLARAIIYMASHDYGNACSMLERHPENREAMHEKRTLEAFFRSSWCADLAYLGRVVLPEGYRG